MNSLSVKIVSAIVALFLIAYVGYQAYNYFYSPYKTETVVETTATEYVESKGVAFRDETIISKSSVGDGIVSYYYPNGSKVAKDSKIALIYNTEKDLENTYLINSIENEISALKECQAQSVSVSQTDSLTKQLNELQLNLLSKINSEDLTGLEETKTSILQTISKKQLMVGQAKNFNKRISELQSEKEKLENSISAEPESIVSGISGFFVDETDGFEDVAQLSDASGISISALNELIERETEESRSIGKIITSYEWRFVTTVLESDIIKFTEGNTINVNFSSFPDKDVPVVIQSVRQSKEKDKYIVTLSCELMDEDLATLRTDTIRMNFDNNRGLKVSKSALYVNGTEKGVYCMLGGEIKFKKVDVIFETEDYFLSKPHEEDGDYLKMYDDVIIQGKDLYDKQQQTY